MTFMFKRLFKKETLLKVRRSLSHFLLKQCMDWKEEQALEQEAKANHNEACRHQTKPSSRP
jgi:hypothetical protein